MTGPTTMSMSIPSPYQPNGLHTNGESHIANGDHHHENSKGSATSTSTANGSRQLDITIVGAGLGGVAAAISCSLAGHHVTVLEAAPKLAEVGAGIQLTPNVTRLLRRWGLSETLGSQAVQPGTIWLRRWEDGKPISRTKLVPDFERDFEAPYWVVHRAHLHQALLDRALELGAEIRVDSRVTEMDIDTGIVTTYRGTVYKSDLIVGCDGLKSITRSLFLDEDAGPVPSPYCAYRATVPMDILMADPELSDIVERPDISLWIGPDRHVMTYPISGGKSFNMVLSHPYNGQTDGWPKDADAVLQEMKDNYAGWDPKLVRIINLIESTAKWQLMAYPRLDSWRHPSGKFVMMGDAVHAMVPYMSQGAAQAIEDAAALGCCLARYGHSKNNDLVHLTKAFEDIRKERAYQVQYRSALNGRIWHFRDGPAQRLRDEGMAATLSDEHYVRSTNQWSDPPTQVWLYGYDVEQAADRFLDEHFPTPEGEKQMVDDSDDSRLREMVAAGLLAG